MNPQTKLGFVLFFIVFLVYGVSLSNQFLWDDEESIVQNQVIHSLANLPKLWTGGIVNSHASGLSGGFYRPLTTTLEAVLWAISHESWIFRLVQVSLHATATVLLFLLFHRILSADDTSKRYSGEVGQGGVAWRDRTRPSNGMRGWQNPQTLLLAFVGSALFAIHPGISEAVLWISTIADPLVAVFLFTALLVVPEHTKTAVLFFLLALVTKENSLVFLPLFFLAPFARDTQNWRLLALWLGAATGLYGLLRFSSVGLGVSGLAFPAPIARASLIEHLFTAPAELTYYLRTFLWPFSLSISRHFVITNPSDVRFWGSLLVIAGIVLLLLTRRSKTVVFFSLWFVVSIIPYLQFIPLSATVADRWLYVPSVGLIGITLTLSHAGYQRLTRFHVFPAVLLTVVLLLFGVTSIKRSWEWRSGLTLFSHDVTVNPDSFDLVNNYGVELFRAGDIAAARQAFERSVTLNSSWWVAYNNAGVVAERLRDIPKAETLYRTSIERGNYYLAYENLTKLLLFQQKKPQEARNLALRGTSAFPASANLWMVTAIASYQLGNRDEALAASRQLYALSPTPETAAFLTRIRDNQPLNLSAPAGLTL